MALLYVSPRRACRPSNQARGCCGSNPIPSQARVCHAPMPGVMKTERKEKTLTSGPDLEGTREDGRQSAVAGSAS